MGWLNKEYTISQEGANETYKAFIDSEIIHSENYLKLYQAAQEAGQENLVRQTKRCISDSIQNLTETSAGWEASGKVTLVLEDKIREQIKKLRMAID